MPERYCWSMDGERYHGDCASRADAVADAVDEASWGGDYEPGEETTVWTAVIVEQSIGDYAAEVADLVVEHILDRIHEEAGELAELVAEPTYSAVDSLQRKLVAALEQWATETGNQPPFHSVAQERETLALIPGEGE
jgi:hypothetical protein